MLVESVAFPLIAQGEVKLTTIGVVDGETVTETLVVPYAERGVVPKVGLEIVTAVEFNVKPREADTEVAST
jgi:hypothetical protein